MDVEHRKIVDKLRRIDCTHADATAAADLIDTLAAEVRRLREVLAAYQIEAARERGGT